MTRSSHLAHVAAWIMLHLLLAAPPVLARERTDWPFSRGDLQGTASIQLRTPQTDKRVKAWQFQAGSHVWGYQPGMSVWSSAAVGVVKGRAVVLVGSYDNNLYCLDAIDGGKLWRYTTGGGIYAAPVLWTLPDGEAIAFVASSDRMVYALDADLGRRLWVHAVQTWRPTIGGARLSSPVVGEAKGRPAIFVGHWVWDKSISGHLQAGGVTALEARTGKKLWTAQLGDNQLSSPIFARIGADRHSARVFVASENGNLYALDAESGDLLWTYTDRDAIKGSPVLFFTPGGLPRVVIGSKFGFVRCLDARNGSMLWSFKTGHWVDGSAAVTHVGPRQVVLIGSYDTHLYALDARTGAPIWRHTTAGGVYSSPAVVRGEGKLKILITSWDHHLHCVDGEDGSLLWSAYMGRPIWDSISLGDSIWSSPVVAEINGQQVVFVGSYAGPLHAVPLAAAAEKALARPSSNLDFWVTMPVVMLIVGLATIFLTRRHRRGRLS